MQNPSHFQQHYSTLQDEDLIQIALTRELLPEAEKALCEELAKRGIKDLSPSKKLLDAETSAAEEERRAKITHHAKARKWGSRVLYSLALFICLVGIYMLFAPGKQRPNDDGGILVLIGIVAILSTWLRAKLSRFWVERVLYRKPPR